MTANPSTKLLHILITTFVLLGILQPDLNTLLVGEGSWSFDATLNRTLDDVVGQLVVVDASKFQENGTLASNQPNRTTLLAGDGSWSLDATLNRTVDDVVGQVVAVDASEFQENATLASHQPNRTRMPPLQFIHITKSGGTAIEDAAYDQAKICWGAKHYFGGEECEVHSPVSKETATLTHSRNITAPRLVAEEWHTPSHWWHPDPFQNSSTFTVVRNPYSRVLSEYYCKYYGPTVMAVKKSNHSYFNHWIQFRIGFVENRRQNGHMLPSHYFVYDDDGNQRINHVLSYERLHDEFHRLMDMYAQQLPNVIRLQPKPERPKTNKTRFTERNFTRESIDAINKYYARDFELFGYDQIQKPEEFLSYDFSSKVLPLW